MRASHGRSIDYYNIYYVDLFTDDFIEYSSPVGGQELSVERHGEDFFETARRDALVRTHEDDCDEFLARFTKENVIREIDESGVFMATYRLLDTGSPVTVTMKVSRMGADSHHIIIGISIKDAALTEHRGL